MSEGRTRKFRVRGSSVELVASARELRREMTPAERQLWQCLRGDRLNRLRFRSQHPVGQFILDFACAKCKLGVEIDGSVHIGNEDQDEIRSIWLQSYGWTMLRFTNVDVITKLPFVLKTTTTTAEPLPSPTKSPQ